VICFILLLSFINSTGACIAGLGDGIAALYSPNEELLDTLKQSAKASGERVWPMPLEESYRKSIKGTLTDVKNIAGQKGGGSITAALFLQEFVEKTPWAHIGNDILLVFELISHNFHQILPTTVYIQTVYSSLFTLLCLMLNHLSVFNFCRYGWSSLARWSNRIRCKTAC